jgi:hypothetical protein
MTYHHQLPFFFPSLFQNHPVQKRENLPIDSNNIDDLKARIKHELRQMGSQAIRNVLNLFV